MARLLTMTAGGSLSNHNPVTGDVLYSVDTIVAPDLQQAGLGRRLLARRIELARALGITTLRGGSRMSGYCVVSGSMSPREYVKQVIAGLQRDPVISFILKLDFRVVALASGYLQRDSASLGYAVIVERKL